MRRQVGTFPGRTSFSFFSYCLLPASVLSALQLGYNITNIQVQAYPFLSPKLSFSGRGTQLSSLVTPCGWGPCLSSPCYKLMLSFLWSLGQWPHPMGRPWSLMRALFSFSVVISWVQLFLWMGRKQASLCYCLHLHSPALSRNYFSDKLFVSLQ